ncbi:MAG: hypothetical protein BZY88_19250 [SAR202 cluster bacterium Io17-Chloro-G9]|nr:MAG: hypothetical protein BZY88_19250 [SAR202 cluster bacterium Io17-Chloro-G9]
MIYPLLRISRLTGPAIFYPEARLPALGLISLLLMLAAAACSSAAAPVDSPGTVPGAVETPQFGGPAVSAVIITTDLAVGPNRVVFGLVDRDGMPVRVSEARVQGVYIQPNPQPGQQSAEVRAEGLAKFMRWPVGQQGVFATRLMLDKVGFWQLRVSAINTGGEPVTAQGAFEVKGNSATPTVGQPAPRSVTPTLEDVGGVENLMMITSANLPDPDLYRLSVHTALESGRPLVLVFSTPAFCVSATCGPQVEIISQVKEKFRDQANFIHVEVFKDPHLLQGDRPVGGTVAAVDEWNLPSEPWTFVMDGQGRVRAKFEQFTVGQEIEAALSEVLEAG